MVGMSDSLNQIGHYIDEHAAQIQENLHATLTQHIAPYMQLTSDQQSMFLDNIVLALRNVFFQTTTDMFWESLRPLIAMLSSSSVQEPQLPQQSSTSGMVFDVCNLVRRSILNVLNPLILSDPEHGLHVFEHIDTVLSDTARIEGDYLRREHARLVERMHCNDDIRVRKDWYERAIKASQLDIWDWNLDTDEVYLAPRLKDMLGYADDEIGNYIEEWVKLIHPDDYQMVKQHTREALKNQVPAYEIEHRILHKDGSLRWIAVKGNMLRNDIGRVTRMSGTIDDITERKQNEIELHRRDTILSAVATVAEQFLRMFSLRHNIEDLLLQLGTTTDVSQVCVFENLFADNTNPILSLRFEWAAPDTQSNKKRLALPTVSYQDAGLTRWKQTLSRGESIYGIVNELPESEQQFLRQHTICSIVAVPIFAGSAWWGFIAFTDTHTERIWSSAEIDAITIAAGIIGAAIHRDHVQKIIDRNESELRKFFRAVEQSPNSIFITDTRGVIEYVNPRFTESTGYSFSEAVGNTPRILKSGETPQEEYANMWQAITSGQEWRGVLRNRGKDGSVFWDSVSISPIVNANGTTTHYVAVEENITERMHAEEALRESEQKFRSVIEQSDDAIILDDEQGMIIEWNKGAEKLSGLKRSDVLGRPSWDVLFTLLPDERKSHRVYRNRERSIKQFHQTGRASWLNQMLEFELQHINGTRRYVQQLAFPIATNKGFMLCSIIRNVTEQKKYQEELQKARDVAEAADRAKTEFLASMSHEIRTPLNAIIGMNNLLLPTPLTSKQLDFVETAVSSGENLLTIINDVLDFSKIEAGKLEIKYASFNLRDCIEESLDLLAAKAAEKRLDLAYFIDDAIPPMVIGDSFRIRQILINLLSNAVKFTSVGEVVVSVEKLSADTDVVFPVDDSVDGESLEQDEETVTIHISVRDTGIGITPEHKNNLFESYSGTSDVRKYGGTGLGLAISKRLSILMGGTMWVESVIGQGSTFHVTIQAQEERFIDPTELEPFKYEHARLKGKRVLIVDDTPCSYQIITTSIEQMGMQPWFTFDGDEALQWMHQGEHFDLILINLLRNHTDGLDLAEKIHALPAYAQVPIVLFVSVSTWHEVSLHMGDTLAASLFRPVKPAQIYETILGIYTQQPVKSRKPVARATLDAHMGDHHPLRLLLAEDTPANQKMFLYSLESLGYHANVADNGLAVLNMIQKQLYDVILMDVQMPEMNGIEATKYIRSNVSSECQPWIIALTAHAMEGDRERCLDAGMNDYVSKPVRVEDLAEALVKAPALDHAIHESFVASEPEQPEGVSQEEPSDGCHAGVPMSRVIIDTVEFPSDYLGDGVCTDSRTLPCIESNVIHPIIDMVEEPAEPEPIAEPTKPDDTIEYASPPTNAHDEPEYTSPHISINSNNAPSPLDSDMTEHFFSMIRKGGKDMMHEFVEMFIHDMSERLTMVQKADSEQQPDDLKTAAHSLKSLSAQVGARHLSAISLKLELLGMENTMDGSSDLVRQAESEYERVKVALREKALSE